MPRSAPSDKTRMVFSLFRKSLRARLWIGASLLAVLIVTISTGNLFLSRQRSVGQSMLGYDFLAFYTAGHFLNTGRPELVYDIHALRAYQEAEARRLGLELRGTYGPFWNPPFYAWFFQPLARFPFPYALHIWWAINLTCFALAMVFLWRLLPDRSCKSGGLLVALMVVSLPFSQALMHGQNTFTSLLILSTAASLWLAAACRTGRSRFPLDLIAGLVAGLMAYKPQLAMVVAVAMAITLGRRAILGMIITGGGLVVSSALLSPDLLADWLTRMPANLRWFQETNHYRWERHITFIGFWRLLLQGHALGPASATVKLLAGLSWLGVAAVVLSALVRARKMICRLDTPDRPVLSCHDAGSQDRRHRRGTCAAKDYEQRRTIARRMIAATFLAMPLLMPFYFDYDLLLMAIPGVLLAADIMEQSGHAADQGREHSFGRVHVEAASSPLGHPESDEDIASTRIFGHAADQWILRAWTAFYLWTLLGSVLAGLLRVQLSVPLLVGLTMLQCARVRRVCPGIREATQPGHGSSDRQAFHDLGLAGQQV